MDKPDMPRQIITSVGEHQVLLSFNNDGEPQPFLDWFDCYGWPTFSAWLATQKSRGLYPDAE